jgi:transcriptional regulator with XRE-family HTH domain
MTTLPTLLLRVGWRAPEMARRLGVREDTVRGWERGKRECPVVVLEWLERIGDAVEDVGMPSGWQKENAPDAQIIVDG